MTKTEKTGLDRFQPVAVLIFDISGLGNQLQLPVAHFWVKKLDQTRPDLWTLDERLRDGLIAKIC